jgi:hypothetical protein
VFHVKHLLTKRCQLAAISGKPTDNGLVTDLGSIDAKAVVR